MNSFHTRIPAGSVTPEGPEGPYVDIVHGLGKKWPHVAVWGVGDGLPAHRDVTHYVQQVDENTVRLIHQVGNPTQIDIHIRISA